MTSSVNLKEEQARLEDLYQHIFPFLLQTGTARGRMSPRAAREWFRKSSITSSKPAASVCAPPWSS